MSQGHLVAVEEDQLPLAEVESGEIHPVNRKTSDCDIQYTGRFLIIFSSTFEGSARCILVSSVYLFYVCHVLSSKNDHLFVTVKCVCEFYFVIIMCQKYCFMCNVVFINECYSNSAVPLS